MNRPKCGQFERMVGLVKRALNKSIGGANLVWSELEEVLLDVEVTLNNRPLTYLEDDVQLPTLTPHAMMFGQPNQLPEDDSDKIESKDLRKRASYLRRCKDVMWTRWTEEYIRSLRERHNHQKGKLLIKTGNVVLIQGDERNRGKWNVGIVVKLIKGRDGVVRAARLRAGKSFLERAVQQLCPMELSCDSYQDQESGVPVLDLTAKEFRPRRDAAAAVVQRIKDIVQQEEL